MEKEISIDEMNETIALFMGGVKQIIPPGGLHGYKEGTILWMYLFSNNPDPITYLDYHTSWDWLLPVGKKIRNILTEMAKSRPPHTASNGDMIEVDIQCALHEYNIEKVHYYIYQFILWYNETINKQ